MHNAAAPSAAPSPWPDRLGILASGACVIHCLLTPVLLSVAAVFAHVLPAEETTHRTLAVLVALLGSLAVLQGLRRHGQREVLWLMLAGLGLIAGAALFGEQLPGHWTEVGVTMAGSLLMITAHRRNHTFCRQCSCAPCARSDQASRGR